MAMSSLSLKLPVDGAGATGVYRGLVYAPPITVNVAVDARGATPEAIETIGQTNGG